MRKRFILVAAAALLAVFACSNPSNDANPAASASGNEGQVYLTTEMGPVGVLARAASMNPQRLAVEFRSEAGKIIRDTIPYTGTTSPVDPGTVVVGPGTSVPVTTIPSTPSASPVASAEESKQGSSTGTSSAADQKIGDVTSAASAGAEETKQDASSSTETSKSGDIQQPPPSKPADPTQTVTFPIGSLGKLYSLDGQMSWTVTVTGLDQRDSVLYKGSQTFFVVPAKVAYVSLSLNALYSTLKVKFPVIDSTTQFIVKVDGKVWGDSSVVKQQRVGDTIRMEHDYLSASRLGTLHTVSIQVRGKPWGIDTLLYSTDTTIVAYSGANLSSGLRLKWVGPYEPPAGQAALAVYLGSVGQVSLAVGYEPSQYAR